MDNETSTQDATEGWKIYKTREKDGFRMSILGLSEPEADLVIRAVNTHDDLVGALERVADRFEATLGAVHTTRGDTRVLRDAREALSRARGE